jgi:hypothetical protein
MCGVENSIAGKPEYRSGRKMGFRDQGYIDIMHLVKGLQFQPLRREAVGVPESNN